MKIRVYYEDTDVGGVVYHSNYLNFCERARSEAFFQKGVTPVLEDGHFVVKKIIADFFMSARLGDELEVVSKLIEMKSVSFSLEQTIYKEGKKLFVLEIVLVYISFEGKVKRLDTETKEFVLSLFE